MKIEVFKDITIAYMRNTGGYGENNHKLMEKFKEYLVRNKWWKEQSTILGIALDNPALVPTAELRYDVGLIIKEKEKIALKRRVIDRGVYAIFEVGHTKEDVQSFWENVMELTKGLPVDDNKPIIERYSMEKIQNHLCEFCVPLK